MKHKNLYEILGVHPKAPPEVIEAAWKARMLKAHPDKGGRNSIAAKINKAKSVLTNENKRADYDEYLRKQNKGLIGNYRVIEQIGEGGFGRTYKAEHVTLEELACLKQNIDITPQDTELLIKEAKTLWHIHHYSLPTLRDFFQEKDGSCVLAMSYVDGVPLNDIVEKKGGVDPEHVSWMTQRLLNALHYLHFHGVVHCDVKPHNIIIKPKEHNAILVDYGFASLQPGRKTMPEGYTPAFAAPELMGNKPPIPETDLYGLGCTMIYALGGNPIAKTYPKGIPSPMKDYFNALVLHDAKRRPNWKKTDLVKDISKIRQDVFGRRHSSKQLNV